MQNILLSRGPGTWGGISHVGWLGRAGRISFSLDSQDLASVYVWFVLEACLLNSIAETISRGRLDSILFRLTVGFFCLQKTRMHVITLISLWGRKMCSVQREWELLLWLLLFLGFCSSECARIRSAAFGKEKKNRKSENIITAKSCFWAQVAFTCHSSTVPSFLRRKRLRGVMGFATGREEMRNTFPLSEKGKSRIYHNPVKSCWPRALSQLGINPHQISPPWSIQEQNC